MSVVSVLLADDHTLVRAGMKALLTTLPEVKTVAEVANGQEALRAIEEQQPDVVLMNISMPTLNGLEAALRACATRGRTRILMFSQHNDEEYVRRALQVGASGYLVKDADRGELELAIRAVARGETWLSPSVSGALVGALAEGNLRRGSLDVLTSRQREILQLIGEGNSTKEIAQALGLSVKTVETHRAQVMQRLGLKGIPALVRQAIKMGLVGPDS